MRTALERFEEKYEPIPEGKGCWEWTGAAIPTGYGRFFFNGKNCLAHRVSYELHEGLIPEGMNALHDCDNPNCVNPNHLFLGTQQDNADDKMKKGRHNNQKKTHCKRGHELTGNNIYQREDGVRHCRICQNTRTKH